MQPKADERTNKQTNWQTYYDHNLILCRN